MDQALKDALKKYQTQRAGAKYRGISWELTFKQWVEWWGDDYSRRGPGHDQLSMQRIADTGPYSLDNIRKGYPRDNASTRGKMERKSTAQKAAESRPVAEFNGLRADQPDTIADDDEYWFKKYRGYRTRASFW